MRNIKTRILEAVTLTAIAKVGFSFTKDTLIPALLAATSVEPKSQPYEPWEAANAQ